MKKLRRLPRLLVVAIVMGAAGAAALTAIAVASCAGEGEGEVKGFIVPSTGYFTEAPQTKNFSIQAEEGSFVVENEVLSDTTHFSFATGEMGACEGETIKEGSPCTEKITLKEYVKGLKAEFKVETTGPTLKATLEVK
jgi:hypothetical protein